MRRTILAVGLLPTFLALGACSASNPGVAGPATATPGNATTTRVAAPSTTPVDAGLGALPSFLPSQTAIAVATGTPEHPALSFPGSPVVVVTPQGTLRVHVDGPSYPPSTRIGATSVECTFAVMLDEASAAIDASALHFDVLDHLGAIHPVSLSKGSSMPAQLLPGERAALNLTVTLPAGQGLLRLRAGSGDASAAWDYTVETD